MQAVILAAGKGTRLKALTADQPKCMLDIGGRTLIQRSLDCIAWAGMNEAIIVTGYLADRIKDHIGDRHGALKVRYRHNRDYDSTGSMMSLLAAVPDLDSPLFGIFESDLLFHRDFAKLAEECTTDTMLTAPISGSGDEVYVEADTDGQLKFLGKSATPAQRSAAAGEFAGITTMSQAFLARYRQTSQTLMRQQERQHHYEEVIYWTTQSGVPFKIASGLERPWTEIDNAADLDRATTDTLPDIERSDGIAPKATG